MQMKLLQDMGGGVVMTHIIHSYGVELLKMWGN